MTATTARLANTLGLFQAKTGPQTTDSYVVKSGVVIYAGRHVALNQDGLLEQYTPSRADLLRVGVALESMTGDGSAPCSVDTSERMEEFQTVTGATTRALSAGKSIWLDESEVYTLTQPSPGIPACGFVNKWRSSEVCDVTLYAGPVVFNLRDAEARAALIGRTRQRLVKDWERVPNATQGVTTDLDFDVTGTNAATATIALQAGGGVSLATAGADDDQAKLFPVSNSAWSGPFAPSRLPLLISKIKTGSSIAGILIHVGLRLTDVVDLTTDADAILFIFDTDSSHTQWMYTHSIGGVDATPAASGVTLAASTNYTLAIVIRADGYAEFYIGDGNTKVLKRVGVSSSAVTSNAAFKAQICAHQALGGAGAKTVAQRYAEISQNHE